MSLLIRWVHTGYVHTIIMDIPQSETNAMAIHAAILNRRMQKILSYSSKMDILTVVKTI